MATPRDNRLQLLLTEEERRQFDAAAERSGLTLSAWLRSAGREKVIRERARSPAGLSKTQ